MNENLIVKNARKGKSDVGASMVLEECQFVTADRGCIDIKDFTLKSDGCWGLITVDGIVTDKQVWYVGGEITKDDFVEMVRDYCIHNYHAVEVEAGNPDNVDESLLEDAEPAVSMTEVERLQKGGFTEGAIIVVGGHVLDQEEESYGVLHAVWQDDKTGIIFVRLTDGRIVEVNSCTVANDVNKHILRMVEAEKGRIIEHAIKFGEQVDRNVEEIIFG